MASLPAKASLTHLVLCYKTIWIVSFFISAFTVLNSFLFLSHLSSFPGLMRTASDSEVRMVGVLDTNLISSLTY